MSLSIQNLTTRSRALALIRDFFQQRDFIEVETPVRIAAPAQETHIDAPPSGSAFLRASPELQMKQLLVAGCRNIYQIGPCFRANECGARHNPEFTMLEWYRLNADYHTILDDTEHLIHSVVTRLLGTATLKRRGVTIDTTPPWPRLTVRQAFIDHAGWDPIETWDADRFDLDMVNLVEPALPRATPIILTDYPAAAASLARLKPNAPHVAERWELYIGGLEIANAYSELCDANIQRLRFDESAAERAHLGKIAYPHDEAFLAALAQGLPPCGGIALGIDRLIMLLCHADEISTVRPFCQSPGQLL